MDASISFTLTQMIIIWTLIGLLLLWMVIFAVLALHTKEKFNLEDLPTPSAPVPAVSLHEQLQQVMTSSSFEPQISVAQSRVVGDIEATPIG